MKPSLGILIVLLLAVGGVCAQETKCPTLTVSGPAGIPKKEEGMVFKAYVKGRDTAPSFSWTASGGEIVEGQGTDSIRVMFDEFRRVTATVRVSGFPEGCPNTASEMAAITSHAPATIIKEESGHASIGKDLVGDAMKNNPGALIWVVIEAKNEASIDPLKSRTIDIWKGFSDVERSSIHFVIKTTKRDHTTIYLVPPGATPPTCAKDEICRSHP